MAVRKLEQDVIADYDVLARYYDPIYDAAFADRIMETVMLSKLVREYNPRAQSLLELGTGTGSLLYNLSGRFDDLTGIDISPAMLDIARQKVPEADLYEGDITDFELGREFDVAICMFDTLNHLRSLGQVEGVFENTERHLSERGIFIFDVVTAGSLKPFLDDESTVRWEIPGGTATQKVRRLGGDDYAADYTVELEQPDGGIATVSSSVHETVYPLDNIRSEASRYFEPIKDFSLYRDPETGTTPATDDSTRAIFVYGKR